MIGVFKGVGRGLHPYFIFRIGVVKGGGALSISYIHNWRSQGGGASSISYIHDRCSQGGGGFILILYSE